MSKSGGLEWYIAIWCREHSESGNECRFKANIVNVERGVPAVKRVTEDKQLSRLLMGGKQVTNRD